MTVPRVSSPHILSPLQQGEKDNRRPLYRNHLLTAKRDGEITAMRHQVAVKDYGSRRCRKASMYRVMTDASGAS
jgi:hypothetical protein